MRTSQQQRQRTKDNPLVLGSFSELSIRNLTGSLGPKNQVIGRADTRFISNGGFGGGTYNHWFQINLLAPAWIIIAKAGPKPKYINVSAYDLNLNPIEGRSIFDADSVTQTTDGEVFFPYVGHVMGAQSDFYNNFNIRRLDKGDERYYPLDIGSYLICISTTRNEPLAYEVAIVVEFQTKTFDLLLEDYSYLLYEDTAESYVVADTTPDYVVSDVHVHSLSEWQDGWKREHQDTDPFPTVLIPLTTQP